MIKKNRSLHFRFVLSYLFLAAFVTLAVIIFSSYLTSFLRKDIPKRNLNLVHAIAGEIKIFLDQPIGDINAFAQLLKKNDYKIDVKGELESLIRYNRFCEISYILGMDGEILNVAPYNNDFIGLSFKNQQYFKDAILQKDGEITLSDSFISSLTGDPAVTISQKAGPYIIVSQINLLALNDIVNVVFSEKKGFICCVDKKGLVIAHSMPDVSSQNININNLEALSGVNPFGNKIFRDYWDGIEGISCVSPVKSTGWNVVIFQSDKEAFGVIDNMQKITLMLVIATTIGLIVISYYMVTRFLSPIKELTSQIKLVEDGDYSRQLFTYYTELGPLVGGFNNMVSSVRNRQADLEENREHLKSILKAIPYGVQEMDNDGTVVYCNLSCTRILGYEESELVGRKIWDINGVGFHDFETYFKDFVKSLKSKSSYMGEFRKKNGDALTLQIDCECRYNHDGAMVGVICIISDITEKVLNEKKIAELAKFPQENPNPVLRISRDGNIIFANPASSHLLECWDCSEGQHLSEEWFEVVRETLRSGELNRKEVTCGNIIYSLVFVPVAQHNYVNIYGLDITNMRMLENRLKQKEKLEAVGQLAGGIAHDFNNQLSGIMGYADMLSESLTDLKYKKYADNILQASERAADMVKKLLAFSRKGKYLSVPVDMHRIIGETVDLLYHSVDKKIKFNQILKADPCTVKGDPGQLQNALLNVALNARDAMPQGGELSMSTEVVYLDQNYCKLHSTEVGEGKFLLISVSDTGCGMSGDLQKKIFEPFFTTKAEGKGTGMGLAAVYGTIKSHRGIINVYSEEGRGSCFRIYLPLEDVNYVDEHVQEQGDALRFDGLRVLLVDDEETMRDVGSDMLEDLGCKVILCKDGLEAIDCYRQIWQNIDLVIIDMVMPNIGGKDAFVEMKKINQDIKAVLVSGYSLNGEAQDIINKGVKNFIQKPFQKHVLVNVISTVIA